MIPFFNLIITARLQGSTFQAPSTWGYEDIPRLHQAGPRHWHLLMGAADCEARGSLDSLQSPIDITADSVVEAEWLPTLQLGGGYVSGSKEDLDDGLTAVWTNNGHTVEAAIQLRDHEERSRKLATQPQTVLKEEQHQLQIALMRSRNLSLGSIDIKGISSLNFKGPTVQLNPMDDIWGTTNSTVYDILQLHLHWGGHESEGSEHLVGGKAHPLELHIVHTQRGNPYPSRSPGGLTVIAVMFEIGEPNPMLVQIQEGKLGLGSSVPASKSFDVRKLLPNGFENNYMTYRGSLTTPGCFQSVNWIIAGSTLTVSRDQLDALRSVESIQVGVPLTNNFRPEQPKNGRVVWMKGRSAYQNLKASSNPR